jgi:hypothetical protein
MCHKADDLYLVIHMQLLVSCVRIDPYKLCLDALSPIVVKKIQRAK